MRHADGKFEWSAWDPNKWDHYHHAGVQVNAYRVCPFEIEGLPRGGLKCAILRGLFAIMGIPYA